jgi:hypothetical protein
MMSRSQELDEANELNVQVKSSWALVDRLRQAEKFEFYCPVGDGGVRFDSGELDLLFKEKMMELCGIKLI